CAGQGALGVSACGAGFASEDRVCRAHRSLARSDEQQQGEPPAAQQRRVVTPLVALRPWRPDFQLGIYARRCKSRTLTPSSLEMPVAFRLAKFRAPLVMLMGDQHHE
ncbi:MAG TPA: hypothetical protein VMU69_19635, partial [Bradyrhizobium sp.]|nr:hypothetical protein [Bradyrhizobium sp.]